MSTADVLRLAHELADVADRLTLAAFGSDPAVRRKTDGTEVTAVDLAVEEALRHGITEAFPEHRILGEESGWGGADADPSTPVWTIDPIDGTTNFVKGNPIFATLIAWSVDGHDRVGVVSAPALGSRWEGVVGSGARQDGRPVAVSSVGRLAEAEVSVGGFDALEERTPGLLATLARGTTRQRGYGDFWAYCLLASGSTDVVIEAQVNPWDVAAVRAVVEAAGGRVTDLDGRDRSDGGSAVASNGILHAELLRVIENHRHA